MKIPVDLKNTFIIFIGLFTIVSCTGYLQPEQLANSASLPERSKFTQQLTNPADTFMEKLLSRYPAFFAGIIDKKKELGVQIIYTQIDRGKKKKGKTIFTDHTFNLDPGTYFYPASTVKLPVAILALQRLNELNIKGLDKNTTMLTRAAGGRQTAVTNDSSAADGRPSVAQYIKKILLVSDNDAFNRLYEFLGQEYINDNLHRMGYADAQIIHRLSVSLTEEENRFTNPVEFADAGGQIIYSKPARKSLLIYADKTADPAYRMGKGYMRGTELVNEPFDFSTKNRLRLQDLHNIVRSIFFPDDIPQAQRFNLSKDDYDFLRKYMSMRPGESVSPVYNPSEYWDNYVKMIFYGSEKTEPEPGIRIFSKTGTAYGFLIESCFFADFTNHTEFMLSAVIYCNSDGIFNDDKYDYDSIGYPFFKNLGRVIYDYERKRARKNKPDLSPILFNYTH